MHFRLFIGTLESFGEVSCNRYIDLLFDYRYRGIIVDSNHRDVDPHPTTIAVLILFETPIPRIYRGIRGTAVYRSPCRSLVPIYFMKLRIFRTIP